MSSETFTTALFLITAVIAAGVLINAIFPVVYQMSGTFSTSTHNADLRIRTDIAITTYWASSSSGIVKVWMKNVGTNKISNAELKKSDVYSGPATNIERLTLGSGTTSGTWNFYVNGDENADWGIGDTLEIYGTPVNSFGKGEDLYFQYVLPNGVSRSITFTST
ncbi:MAG: flagellin [Methanoregulaceae archaeon]